MRRNDGNEPLTTIPERGFQSFLDAPIGVMMAQRDPPGDHPQPGAAVIGVPYAIPYTMGQSRSACAPAYIREKSLRFRKVLQPCRDFDAGAGTPEMELPRMVDCGDVRFDPLDIRGGVERTTQAIQALLERRILPVALGGDDAVPIPVLRAFEGYGPITVIQIDEHLDWAREINGVTDGYSSPMRNAAAMPWVEQIVQIGLHGSGLCEQFNDATAAGNMLITDREVHAEGMAAIVKRIPSGRKYVISLDVDGLDPSICPAVSHPEPGGLDFRETDDLFRGLAAKGTIAGVIVAELVPEHDLHGLGGHTIARLLINVLGSLTKRA